MRELAVLYATGVSGTVALSVAGFFVMRGAGAQRTVRHGAALFALVLAVAYFGAMLWMGAGKAAALNHYADRATHLEIMTRSLRGLGLTSPMSAEFFTGSHWFAAHLTPIIYVAYLPGFALAPFPITLHVLETVYLMLAAVPIGWFAARRLGAASGWLFGAAYLAYPTVHYINLYGLAYLELSIPILAWALFALESRRDGWFVLCALLLLTTREDASLVAAALGVYAMFRGHRRIGAVVTVASAVYFVVALKVIIPAFRSDQSLVYMNNYRAWGNSVGDIAQNVVLHPFSTIRQLLSVPRVGNVVMYLLPVAGLALLDPLGLFVAAPNIATTFLSGSVTNYSFTLYYLAPTIPVVFFAAVRGADALRRRLEVDGLRPAVAVLVAALSANVFFGPSPASLQFWNEGYQVGQFHTTSYYRSEYVPTAATVAARDIAARVPAGAQISAEQHLLPILYDRARMLVFPTMDAQIDHVMIDRAKRAKSGWAATFMAFRMNPEQYYAAIEGSSDWELVAENGGARLFRRTGR